MSRLSHHRLLAAFLLLSLVALAAGASLADTPGLAANATSPAPIPVSGSPGPKATPLVQCDLGLALPLLLVGLATLGGRATARKRK